MTMNRRNIKLTKRMSTTWWRMRMRLKMGKQMMSRISPRMCTRKRLMTRMKYTKKLKETFLMDRLQTNLKFLKDLKDFFSRLFQDSNSNLHKLLYV